MQSVGSAIFDVVNVYYMIRCRGIDHFSIIGMYDEPKQ